MNIQINIEKGKNGLWYLTSPQIKGLLIAKNSIVECIEALPQAYHDLLIAKAN